jgi:hypothetical protein
VRKGIGLDDVSGLDGLDGAEVPGGGGGDTGAPQLPKARGVSTTGEGAIKTKKAVLDEKKGKSSGRKEYAARVELSDRAACSFLQGLVCSRLTCMVRACSQLPSLDDGLVRRGE